MTAPHRSVHARRSSGWPVTWLFRSRVATARCPTSSNRCPGRREVSSRQSAQSQACPNSTRTRSNCSLLCPAIPPVFRDHLQHDHDGRQYDQEVYQRSVGRLEPLGGKTKLMCGSRLVRLRPEPHGVPVYVSAPLPASPPTTPRNEGLLSGCSRKKRVSKIFVNGSTL